MRWAARQQVSAELPVDQCEPLVVGGVALDVARRTALVAGYVIHMPAREAALLQLLMRCPGRVLSADELRPAGGADEVRRTFRRLARRLAVSPLLPPVVERVGPWGYRFTQVES